MLASRGHHYAWGVILAALAALTGCESRQTSAEPALPPARTTSAPPAKRQSAARSDPERLAPQIPAENSNWPERFASAEAAIAAGKLEEADRTLTLLDELDLTAEPPTADQERQRQDLELKLAAARREAIQQQHESSLASAQQALAEGRFVDALRLATEVARAQPSVEQHERAAAIRVEVRRHQEVRKAWQPQLQLLASTSRRDLETIQAELRKDPEVAFPLLAELSHRIDEPALAAGALETLAVLDRPQQALPLLVAVLSRDSQRELWEVAKRQIVSSKHPGAGRSLLTLATSDASIEQRLSALDVLAQVIDPPPDTLAALLPLLHRDGPLLRRALAAASHAAAVHGQYDLANTRAVGELTPVQEDQFAALPARLVTLSAALDDSAQDVALAAQELLVTLRLAMPQPLSVARVQAASADAPEAPSAAILDGVWDSADLKTMWRHSADKPGTITLDLGQERTIVCVKIWNWNEPGGAQRGWKEAQISVGRTETELVSVARGIVPPAPGAAEMPDYGTLISVSCARGRYLRLEAASLWQPGSHSGLAEVQVLGF